MQIVPHNRGMSKLRLPDPCNRGAVQRVTAQRLVHVDTSSAQSLAPHQPQSSMQRSSLVCYGSAVPDNAYAIPNLLASQWTSRMPPQTGFAIVFCRRYLPHASQTLPQATELAPSRARCPLQCSLLPPPAWRPQCHNISLDPLRGFLDKAVWFGSSNKTNRTHRAPNFPLPRPTPADRRHQQTTNEHPSRRGG